MGSDVAELLIPPGIYIIVTARCEVFYFTAICQQLQYFVYSKNIRKSVCVVERMLDVLVAVIM